MERNLAKFIGRTITFALFTAIASTACFAQANYGGGRLEGTWDAVVTITDCETGKPLEDRKPFASIANFNRGGTFLGSTSGRPQASRTPEHGVWRHVSGNTYIFKFKSYDFDQTGNPVGYGILTHTIELNETADAYTSSGSVRIFLMDGTQVAQGCSDAVGTRFTL